MLSDREATSEKSASIRKGVSYDDVYPSGCEPMEDSSWSPAREPFTLYLVDQEEEKYEENKEEGEEEEGDKREEKGEKEEEEGKRGDEEGHVKALYSPPDTDGKQLLPHNVPEGF